VAQVPPAETISNVQETTSEEQVGAKRKASEAIPATMMKRMRLSTEATPVPTRKTVTHFTTEEINTLQTTILSLIHAKGGVLDLSLRIDLEYLTYVESHFPAAPREVDDRVLNALFDSLESQDRVKRVMISCSSAMGMQFKSILVLPDVDPTQNEAVAALGEQLVRELGVGTGSTAVEVVRSRGRTGTEGNEIVIAKATKRPTVPKGVTGRVTKSVPVPVEPVPLLPHPSASPPSPPSPAPAVPMVVTETIPNSMNKLLVAKPKRQSRKRKVSPIIINGNFHPPPPSLHPSTILMEIDIPSPTPNTRRGRVAFNPAEDQMLYQSVVLTRSYSAYAQHTPWVLISSLFPGRRPPSLKRRWDTVFAQNVGLSARFLEAFERGWWAAQGRGEVPWGPLRVGTADELKVVLEWFRDNVGEVFDLEGVEKIDVYVSFEGLWGVNGA
jgi:hypothetical protein